MYTRGYFTLLVLVFSAVFITLLTALSGYIFVEKRSQLAEEHKEDAFHIAEAGLEYYRWHLAHWPSDIKDGTNHAGPYVHTVSDPEGGVLGSYSLDISSGAACGNITSVAITSTGWTQSDPTRKRVLFARYTRPSVAEYSAIINSNVWAGPDRVISGPYHSNGGIRMDGTHNADVTSGVATWLCDSSYGCSPSANKNGVFGSGGPTSLWQFPSPTIDFNGITADLVKLKGYATSSGIYIGPSGGYGWKVVFNSDGTVQIHKVVGTRQIWGYSTENGWLQERTVMSNVQGGTTYTVPATCPVIFIEDDAWIEGVVKGKITLAAADVSAANVDRSIVLDDSLTYANTQSGLTAIGEKDVLVGLQVPDIMNISGIFIAQKGHFGRNHYCVDDCTSTQGNQGLPADLDDFVFRSTLNTKGTVVSNGRFGTKWTSGVTYISGFNTRNDTYDTELAKDPPPFTPTTSDDYKFVDWREVN